MDDSTHTAIAIVGIGAILPDAPNAAAFWQNIKNKRYSISEVPPERWSIADYYDPDPRAPDKTYSKIGAWVRGFQFDWKQFRIPPKVAAAMDEGQQWAVTIAAEALADYGYPTRPLDGERTGVIIGTAIGGELHYITHLRLSFPEYANLLAEVTAFRQLPPAVREAILAQWQERVQNHFPEITEDSMPGELPNIVAGRIANVFNLRGPNFITDAACASTFAAIDAAIELLRRGRCEAVLTGGVDRNMGANSFIKFCKIGALSATGTRPFGEGADGFVMGEGSAVFLLKRLADAERDGDTIYAVIRGIGGSSDGKGKGITAPNPIGQTLAVRRAWEDAGLDPATCTLVEAHGTSTRVGDVVEVESLTAVFKGAPRQSIALGSVKSNIGHLKAAAGAAGLLKAVMALHEKVLPPTLNAEKPNPHIDFASTPFFLNHELREWPQPRGFPRRAGVSAYGFGGTNFHIVLEEYIPGRLKTDDRKLYAGVAVAAAPEVGAQPSVLQASTPTTGKPPLRGILALGAATPVALKDRLDEVFRRVQEGWTPPLAAPDPADLAAAERLVIDFGDHEELLERIQKARKALGFDNTAAWKALTAQGIFRGSGRPPGKIAFLFPGQGSQYVNMGRELVAREPVVRRVFSEADRVMTPILGRPLTAYIFVDAADPVALKQAEFDLMQTAITQPAVLTMDTAIYELLGAYGMRPDMVMGHSLGEYAALIAAGIMSFADALEASAARGREMASLRVDDNGWMAAVMGPLDAILETLKEVDGYVIPANINSYHQVVIGGASKAVEKAIELFNRKGMQAMRIPVSHAFHTAIVAPASKPLRRLLDRLDIRPPQLPLIANVTGDLYPTTVEAIKAILEQQIASPVQWAKGLETLYAHGCRTFVEVGPKKALKGFVDDVLGDKPDVIALFTNHPKFGELPTFNQALCGLYAAGYGVPATPAPLILTDVRPQPTGDGRPKPPMADIHPPAAPVTAPEVESTAASPSWSPTTHEVAPMVQPLPANDVLGPLAQALQQALAALQPANRPRPYDRNEPPAGSVVISGTGLGLPGAEKAIMDPDNAMRILRGEQFIDLIPERFRHSMQAKRITRLVKAEDGSGHFQVITDPDEVIKLAGRPGTFDLAVEYGVPAKLIEALDTTTQLAMAAGLDALREAGIPLIQTFKPTSTGKFLPDRWLLPEALRDETGVIFASAFPGGDRFAEEFRRYYTWQNRLDQLNLLEDLRRYTSDPATLEEINRRIAELRELLEREPYYFDRRFIFRILAMGHSQFAEYIGARGPNTHVNAACASTTQAIAIAEDWIRSGRCRRVLVIAADNVTGDNLLEWVGAGFLATGAAATDSRVDQAALPFDKRRHGTILGMGACALVVESEDAVRERGMRGIVELLSSETSNSAYHGTRLDVEHISMVMENLVAAAERRFGINRHAIAPQMVFMSHETFTPARGGSASAEVVALRKTFGEAANAIIVANTKGFTGHPMGVGVEDVIAIKALEYGIVPPVPNFKEVDPELGVLNLSRGGRYPVHYALHLAAGFGSQIAMTLVRRIPGGPDRIDHKAVYRRWLADVSGYDNPELEVVKRVLRLKSNGAPGRTPIGSTWQYGTGPTMRAAAPGDGMAAAYRPAPMAQIAELLGKPTAGTATSEPEAGDAGRRSGDGTQATTPAYPLPVVSTPPVESSSPAASPAPAILPAPVAPPAPPTSAVPPVSPAPTAPPTPPVSTPVAPPTPAAPPSSPAPSTPTPTPDPIVTRILDIVAAKTGYPHDMLDLDLDLEADLGIDTVKQAETFAAIREAFAIPFQEGLSLRDYPTLASVVAFVRRMRPDLDDGSRTTPAAPPTPAAPAPATPPVRTIGTLEDADKIPRRVPVPVLRPATGLCKPTGVTLDKQSRVVVMLDHGGVGKALVNRLTKLGVTPLIVEPGPATEALIAQLQTWLAAGPIQGVYWLAALDEEPPLDEMTPEEWREHNRLRVKNLYAAMRTLYDSVRGPGRFLVSATRLGGLHGYDATGAIAPLGGAVTGFTKAYHIEQSMRPEGKGLLVKAVDFERGRKTAALADSLIAETLFDPGVVEVGYHNDLRYSIGLREQSARDGRPGMVLGPETVFLVTGAAGGITSAIVADLAAPPVPLQGDSPPARGAGGRGIFYLLDRVPCPAREDEYVRLFRTDKEALKQRLIAEARGRGEKPTPKQIDEQILAIERSEAALRAVEAVEAAGGTAYYVALDLRDGEAIDRVIEDVRRRYGRIDVILHAGGLLIDRTLPNKEPQQFDLVFDVKADGFYHLLRAARDMPIGATVVFSSVAGRFGNNGQTDYAAANDLLCKITSWLRHRRPETRGMAIDWTAWGQIGMASRGSIPQIMEALGVDMLPPEAGVPTVRRELTYGGTRGEIVVAGRLGAWLEESDPTGGLDPDKVAALLATRSPRLLMVGAVRAAKRYGGLEVETTLDPRKQPFLYDHMPDPDTPWLPGVMATEAMAEVAGLLAPGYRILAVENEEMLGAFKFFRMEPRTLYLNAQVMPASGDELEAHVLLRSVTTPTKEGLPTQVKTHFTATVRLGLAERPAPTMAFTPPTMADLPITAEAIYNEFFHGPSYRVIARAGVVGHQAIGRFAADLPPQTDPADVASLMAPRLVELCFQLAALWHRHTYGAMAFPLGFASLTAYRQETEATGPLYGIVTTADDGETFDGRVVDEAGHVFVELKGYRTVARPV